MPLASWYSLHFYGPGAAAMVTSGVGSSSLGANAQARAGLTTTGVGSVPLARPTRLRNSPVLMAGAGSIPTAGPMRGRARIALTVQIGGPTSPGAVSDELLDGTIVDNGITLREAFKLLLASAAGDIENAGGSTRRVKAAGGTQTRIEADVDATSRDVTLIDLTG